MRDFIDWIPDGVLVTMRIIYNTATNATNGLRAEAVGKGYWKELKNPFNGQTASNAYADLTTTNASTLATNATTVTGMAEGFTGYAPVNTTNPTSYAIYGAGKASSSGASTGALVTDKGSRVFFLSNS